MSQIISNRSEILFIYDIKDNNPNGDPLDSNKPRVDEENNINIVTDVRLKRTVRDYLMNFKDQDIFVKEKIDEKGKIQDAKLRAQDFLEDQDLTGKDFHKQKEIIQNKILNDCIDVRLFGATIPLDLKIEENEKSKNVTGSIKLTGPVQFRMGRSLHRVEMKYIKGTGAFASSEGKTQKTLREEYILPYSLISFYGIINENAAKHTNLVEDDIELLLDGLWNGTKNLISRSKSGQEPRFLLKINYKKNNYHIGDLDRLIMIESEKQEEAIRDISELSLNTSELAKRINEEKDVIKDINLKIDGRLKTNLKSELDSSINVTEISW